MNWLEKEDERQKIVFGLNARLQGGWSSKLLSSSSVIAFLCIDKDGTRKREYSWAIAELGLARSTEEVLNIIAGKAQEELAKETNSQRVMRNVLGFK